MMATTDREKELLRLLLQQVIRQEKNWLGQHGILVSEKHDYWMLNYQQGVRNDFNRLVRGMVVRKPAPDWSGDTLSLIASFPFTRFFNMGEPEAAPVNLAAADMLEKLDGTSFLSSH